LSYKRFDIKKALIEGCAVGACGNEAEAPTRRMKSLSPVRRSVNVSVSVAREGHLAEVLHLGGLALLVNRDGDTQRSADTVCHEHEVGRASAKRHEEEGRAALAHIRGLVDVVERCTGVESGLAHLAEPSCAGHRGLPHSVLEVVAGGGAEDAGGELGSERVVSGGHLLSPIVVLIPNWGFGHNKDYTTIFIICQLIFQNEMVFRD